MILGVRACLSRSGITSRTRQTHTTTEPWRSTTDHCGLLKSRVDLAKCQGPAAVNKLFLTSHGRGHRFETCHAHEGETPGSGHLQRGKLGVPCLRLSWPCSVVVPSPWEQHIPSGSETPCDDTCTSSFKRPSEAFKRRSACLPC